MSGSNYWFLTCIQISHEAGKVIWYFHLFKNFPVCCDPHSQRLEHSQWSRSRCFSEIPLFFLSSNGCWQFELCFLCLFWIQTWTSGSSWFTYCWSLAWRIFKHHFASVWSEVAQLCPTICNPMDCSLPGSSVHGIFQARVLEWVAISFFPAQGLNPGLPYCRQMLYHLSHREA